MAYRSLNGIKRTCETCKKEFFVYPSVIKYSNGGRFCSSKCKYIWMKTLSGELAYSWGRIERTCEICGSSFFVPKNFIKRGIGKLCSKKCRSVRKSQLATRENNHNWKHGDKLLIRRLSENKRRARLLESTHNLTKNDWDNIKAIFKNTCPSCGKQEPEIKLTMDHIIPINKYGDNSKENIQPLCKQCNTKKQTKIKIYNPDGSCVEVFNMMDLIKAVANGEAPENCVKPNQPVLNKMATALKQTMNVRGVRAISRRV